jgi:hypothetical protein
MGEAVVTMFIVIAVMTVSMALFGGWLAVVTVKGLSKLLGALLVGQWAFSRRRRPMGDPVCERCRQVNPPAAHYCRRCGSPI